LSAKVIVPAHGIDGKARSVLSNGREIRAEFDRATLNATLGDDTISGEVAVVGGVGKVHLMRVAALDSTTVARFSGAYRFASGQLLLVDRFHDMPSFELTVTDPGTGIVRYAYAISDSVFVTGPALSVPYPTQTTLSFSRATDGSMRLVHRAENKVLQATRVPVREEEVRFNNGEVTLAGTLLLPTGAGPFPAIVLTHSSGPAFREWTWGFGYLMAAKGVAVLAFDKRGVGQSTGNWLDATFEELADDAVAAARFLQARADINAGKIGFWGLSQGAWIGPLAATRFKEAAFVVAVSGGGLSPERAELLDSEWELEKAGFPDSVRKQAIEFQTAKNVYMRTGSGWDEYAARRAHARPLAWFALPGTDLAGPATADHINWTRGRRTYFYDPIPTLTRLACPLLSIFGGLDTPVGVKENTEAISRALHEAGRTDFVVKVFPYGRHNLMDMRGAAPNEYHRLTRFVPGFFDTMSSFILSHAAP
jgi:pimeloyl-ACP methyl ester carboxylesterase